MEIISISSTYEEQTSSKHKGWMRFTGITLAQSVTITSASLNIHIGGHSVNIRTRNANNPGNPGSYADFGAGVGGDIAAATGTPRAVDVTAKVQSLVNSNDYTNEAMLFYGLHPNQNETNASIKTKESGSGTDPELVIVTPDVVLASFTPKSYFL